MLKNIGRNNKNEIVLSESEISNFHAQLISDDDNNIFINDLNSENGTFVNGNSISQSTQLNKGDMVKLSGVPFQWETHVTYSTSSAGAGHNQVPPSKKKLEPEVPKPKNTPPISVASEPAQKKRRFRLLKTLLTFFTVVVVVGFILFQFMDNDTKRAFFQALGLENSEFVKSTAMSSYIEIEPNATRNLLNTKWVIAGTIWNKHSSKVINTIRIRVTFSDGSEVITINKTLNPDPNRKKIFRKTIRGHKHQNVEQIEVIDAY